MLTQALRGRLAKRAAQFLENDEADWTTGYWLFDQETSQYFQPDDRSIGKVREWLRDHGFGARNRRCSVCAEGALLLAFAADDTIGDDVLAYELLAEFQEPAGAAACRLEYLEYEEDWDGIPEWNDSNADQGQAINLLNEIGNL